MRFVSNKRALPIIASLFDNQTTAQELGVDSVTMALLKRDGLVRSVDAVQTGKPGRPAHVYACTDKARKRVKRARAR